MARASPPLAARLSSANRLRFSAARRRRPRFFPLVFFLSSRDAPPVFASSPSPPVDVFPSRRRFFFPSRPFADILLRPSSLSPLARESSREDDSSRSRRFFPRASTRASSAVSLSRALAAASSRPPPTPITASPSSSNDGTRMNDAMPRTLFSRRGVDRRPRSRASDAETRARARDRFESAHE